MKINKIIFPIIILIVFFTPLTSAQIVYSELVYNNTWANTVYGYSYPAYTSLTTLIIDDTINFIKFNTTTGTGIQIYSIFRYNMTNQNLINIVPLQIKSKVGSSSLKCYYDYDVTTIYCWTLHDTDISAKTLLRKYNKDWTYANYEKNFTFFNSGGNGLIKDITYNYDEGVYKFLLDTGTVVEMNNNFEQTGTPNYSVSSEINDLKYFEAKDYYIGHLRPNSEFIIMNDSFKQFNSTSYFNSAVFNDINYYSRSFHIDNPNKIFYYDYVKTGGIVDINNDRIFVYKSYIEELPPEQNTNVSIIAQPSDIYVDYFNNFGYHYMSSIFLNDRYVDYYKVNFTYNGTTYDLIVQNMDKINGFYDYDIIDFPNEFSVSLTSYDTQTVILSFESKGKNLQVNDLMITAIQNVTQNLTVSTNTFIFNVSGDNVFKGDFGKWISKNFPIKLNLQL